MRQVTETTKASGFEYEVTANQFESLNEAFEYWEGEGENPDETCLGIVNAAMLQNAKQGDKGSVRSAIAEAKKDEAFEGDWEDHPKIVEAIAKHRSTALDYVIGKPRGGRLADGSTKTEVKDRVGSAVDDPEALAEINAILAKYGK